MKLPDPKDQLNESCRLMTEQFLEEAKQLFDMVQRHEEQLGRLGRDDLSICSPGGPADGYETFFQHDPDGPYMIRLFCDWRSAFLWEDDASWLLRPWSDVAESALESVVKCATFEEAVGRLEGFDHSQPTPSRPAREEADQSIVTFLGSEPKWMLKERQSRTSGCS